MIKEYGKDKLIGMYQMMYLIRKYEERIYYLFLEGVMPGTIHQCHGQEACAVGVLYDLRKSDYMTTTHRPAGHALAKGVPLKDMMAEMFGKPEGCCRGYGGAMHVGDMEVGALPAIAIVGGGVPIGSGLALACKLKKTDNICVSYMGDGAVNEGAVHESMNGASIWKLPQIFVIENNLYGASTSIDLVAKKGNLAERGEAYGIPNEVVDGMDVIAVNQAANRAIERARRGEGPTVLELKTYRYGGHSRNDACAYRTKEEEAEWKGRDAIQNLKQRMLDVNLLGESEFKEIELEIDDSIEKAVDYAKGLKDHDPENALNYAYAEEGLV